MSDISLIAKNLEHIRFQIAHYETLYHRPPNSVKLLAASKGQSIEKISAAIAAGQLIFGESYLQEALKKIQFFKDAAIEWHFIGRIQSNKTKKIAEHFAWVHSVCDMKIAQRLNEQRPAHLPPLNICLEVNISHSTTKAGLLAENVLKTAEFCQRLPNLRLRGLMALPSIKTIFAEQRAEFKKLYTLFEMLNAHGIFVDTLSMGMSADLSSAIAEGATIVRVGTAIFGARELKI